MQGCKVKSNLQASNQVTVKINWTQNVEGENVANDRILRSVGSQKPFKFPGEHSGE